MEHASLHLHHRSDANSKHSFWQAFKSNEDVLLIGIKSLHTRNRLKEMVDGGEVTVRSLRILTLNPDTPLPIFEALARHINEPVINCITDSQDAYDVFRELESKHLFIRARRYDTLPTMQGVIVINEYAQIELLTYQTNPDERTAIVVTHKEAPESLMLITERFNKLWEDSVP